jgi:hypothetical protein
MGPLDELEGSRPLLGKGQLRHFSKIGFLASGIIKIIQIIQTDYPLSTLNELFHGMTPDKPGSPCH